MWRESQQKGAAKERTDKWQLHASVVDRGLALSRVTAASQELLHGEGILSDCGITTSREAQGAVSVPGKSMGPSTGTRSFLQACQTSVAPVASWKNSSSAKTEVSYFA